MPVSGQGPRTRLRTSTAKSELEAQRITRRLQLVKPPGALILGLDGGLTVTADDLAIGALEAAHGARDELAPVVGEVERLTQRGRVANGHRSTIFVKVDPAGQAAADG